MSLRFLFLFFLLTCTFSSAIAHPNNIQSLLDERTQKQYNVGIIVAIVTPTQTYYYQAGHQKSSVNSPLISPDTLFPIASLTKVFTTLAFANQVVQHKVNVNSEAQPYMPKPIILPSWHNRPILLVDLATHTASLPVTPGINFTNDPYRSVTINDIANFFDHYQLPYKPGTKYVYSNLSIALLGMSVATISQQNFKTYLNHEILKPLQMNSTFFQVPEQEKNRLVTGYDPTDHVASYWQFIAMAPAGGLYSSAKDLVQFLQANMGLKKTSLYPAMQLSHQPMHAESPGVSHSLMIGLGWDVNIKNGIIGKTGNYPGFSSFLGFRKDKSLGVVVLANTSNIMYTENIGQHILNSSIPLLPLHQAINLSAEQMKRFIGKYCLSKSEAYQFTLQANHLEVIHLTKKVQVPQPFNIYPMSHNQFFGRVGDAVFTFQIKNTGEVSGLSLLENNKITDAKKCD